MYIASPRENKYSTLQESSTYIYIYISQSPYIFFTIHELNTKRFLPTCIRYTLKCVSFYLNATRKEKSKQRAETLSRNIHNFCNQIVTRECVIPFCCTAARPQKKTKKTLCRQVTETLPVIHV